MPPNIYNVYGQAGVGRDLLDSLLESDKYKDVYSQGLQTAAIKGGEIVKQTVEDAQEEIMKESGGPWEKLGFDPVAIGLGAIPGFGPLLSATYSGVKAAAKSKQMSEFSKKMRKKLKKKYGKSAGFLMDLYERTGMEKGLKEMETDSLDDALAGAKSAIMAYGTGEVIGQVGDKLIKPGTITTTAGEVTKLKPTPTASKIGIKSPDFIKQGLGPVPSIKPFDKAFDAGTKYKGGGIGMKSPDFIKSPKPVTPMGQEKLLHSLAMSQVPKKLPGVQPSGVGIRQQSPTFKTTAPKAFGTKTPGYAKQILDYYKPRNVAGRAKDLIKEDKELMQAVLQFLQGLEKR